MLQRIEPPHVLRRLHPFELLRLLATLWPRLAHDVWLNSVSASRLIPHQARFFFLRIGGLRMRRCTVMHGVEWFGSGTVTIESGVVINRGVVINHSGGLHMGAGSGFGPGTLVLTASHEIGPPTKRYGAGTTQRVTVGAGTWVGANVTILPGVTIGAGCIIAAGAVVTKDCAPNTLYAGVPAVAVRSLDVADVQAGVPRSDRDGDVRRGVRSSRDGRTRPFA